MANTCLRSAIFFSSGGIDRLLHWMLVSRQVSEINKAVRCPRNCDRRVVRTVVSLAFLPPDLLYFGVGFLLFRLYDITKPWPINFVDRCVKSGFGVMADDILAALYVYLTFGIFLIW